MRSSVLLVVAALAMFCAGARADLAHDVLSAMDLKTDPCDDFYQFSCGNWIKNTPLPPDDPVYLKAITVIFDNNDNVLSQIVANETFAGTKIYDFYQSCMNTTTINSLGLDVLNSIDFELFDEIDDVEELMETVAYLQSIGVPALFSASVDIDAENVGQNCAQFDQGGYYLPDRVFYLDNSTDGRQLLMAYQNSIVQLFQLLGLDADAAASNAAMALQVETLLATIAVADEDRTNPFSLYHKLDLAGLLELSPNLPWDDFIAELPVPAFVDINVISPDFFGNLSAVVNTVSGEAWSAYLAWQFISVYAPFLNDTFYSAWFNFSGVVLQGQSQPSPRNVTCLSHVDAALGDLFGFEFAQLAFDAEAAEEAATMLETIEAAMKEDLQTVSWMDNTTRAIALQKLSLIQNMIGAPQFPDRYDELSVDPEQFFENQVNAAAYAFEKAFLTIGQPPDKNAFSMSADTVNAYYDPTRNQIVLLAGIAQFPYFSTSLPLPCQYGGVGLILGHELTHAFDSSGSDYTGNGTLSNWWQPQSAQNFQERAQCFVEQYSKFEVLPGVYVNGQTTLGENIADNGGLRNSHLAYLTRAGPSAQQPSFVPQFTNEQLSFIWYAQGWCAVASPEYLREIVVSDVHSPPKFRVLGPMMNSEYFAKAFNCPVNSPMNPANKCQLW